MLYKYKYIFILVGYEWEWSLIRVKVLSQRDLALWYNWCLILFVHLTRHSSRVMGSAWRTFAPSFTRAVRKWHTTVRYRRALPILRNLSRPGWTFFIGQRIPSTAYCSYVVHFNESPVHYEEHWFDFSLMYINQFSKKS